MSERTKAELEEALNSAIALNRRYERERQETDPEARAIADCIKAVSGLKGRISGYSREEEPNRPAIRRVLNAAAARFGVSPDFEAITQVVERRQQDIELSQKERAELEELRRLRGVLDAARWGEPY